MTATVAGIPRAVADIPGAVADIPGAVADIPGVSAEIRPIRFDPDWFSVVREPFFVHAIAGGLLVAVAAGVLGYFVVVRQHAFASHALAHIGFPGATGAALVGAPVTLGLLVFTILGAVAIGAVGKEVASREVATGSVLAFATGLGVLFASLQTRSAGTITNILFGSLLTISYDQLVTFALLTALVVLALAVFARPLVFASVDPQVARARGVPVRLLGALFLLLLAVVVTMAVQVVGTLLLFALVVTPAATALRLTARPVAVVALGTAINVAAVLVGLVLAAMFNLPASFFIVTLAVAVWAVVLVVTRDSAGRRSAAGPPAVLDGALELPLARHHPEVSVLPRSAGD